MNQVQRGLKSLRYYADVGGRICFIQVSRHNPQGNGYLEPEEIKAVLEYISDLENIKEGGVL